MAAQHATASSSRHRSRSSNTLVNERLLDFITVPPPPTVPTTACEHFLLSLVPQLNRLNARNQTKAKIAFLQVLDDLETSQESRPTPYAVPTQPYERHRSVLSDTWEGSRHPPFAPHHMQPWDSLNQRHFDLGGTLRPTSLAMGVQCMCAHSRHSRWVCM